MNLDNNFTPWPFWSLLRGLKNSDHELGDNVNRKNEKSIGFKRREKHVLNQQDESTVHSFS